MLEVQQITTDFQTERGPLRAVDNVSFSLAKGETLGIAGETGSGKSALVRSIVGLVPESASVSGAVLVGGRSLRSFTKAEGAHLLGGRVGMVLQDPMTSLNPVKKIGQQLVDPMRFHLRLNRVQARERAVELLDMVRLPQARRRLRQYPHELSGGMRQRVGIAIALSCRPELLIADEPTTALDVTVQKDILDLLKALQAELAMGLILITHDLGVLATRTDRVLIMYAGRLVEDAGTAQLFGQPLHPYTVALMAAVPRLAGEPHTRLAAIPGQPPDLVSPPEGCRFAPRCDRAAAACRASEPELEPLDTGGQPSDPPEGRRRVRCFFPADRPSPSAPVAGQPVPTIGVPPLAGSGTAGIGSEG